MIKSAAVIIGMGVLLLRPSVVSEINGSIGLVLLFIGLLLYISVSKEQVKRPPFAVSIVLLVSFWAYLYLIYAVNPYSNGINVFNSVISNILALILCISLISYVNLTKMTLEVMTSVTSLLGFSALTTLALFFIVPNLSYFYKLDIPSYPGAGEVYFPFSVKYGNFTSTIVLPRFLGIMREPGIMQAIAFSFLIREIYNVRRLWVCVGLIGIILCAFSTTTLIVIPIAIGLFFLGIRSSRKARALATMAGVVLITSGPVIINNTPLIGVESKSSTHGSSLSDRAIAMENFYSIDVFGQGIYNSNEKNAGINLISQSNQIGIIGLLLIFMAILLIYTRLNGLRRFPLLVTLAPIIVTMVISQPLIDAPGIWLIIFILAASFVSKSPKEEEEMV